MSLTKTFMILSTMGFRSELSEDAQVEIMEHTLRPINSKTDFIVYYPPHQREHLEDEGRTLIASVEGLTKKVYVKLDDFGDPAKWTELYDPETVEHLKKAGTGRFVITFMLAEARAQIKGNYSVSLII